MSDETFSRPRGRLPKWLMWSIGGLLAFSILIIGLALTLKKDESGLPTISIGNNLLPSDFFGYDKEEEPEEAIPTPIEFVESPEPEIKIVYRDRPIDYAAQQELDRARQIIRSQQEPPLKADEIFKQRLDPTEELRQQMRAKLVGGGNAQFSHNFSKGQIEYKQVRVDKNNNNNWDSFGSASDIASYPVDMERVVTNDMFIRCTMIDAIYSEMEGRVTCRITYNIYGAHGRKILIPAGSVAVGQHGVIEAIGNTRVPVTWNQITTPEGVRIVFGEEIGSSDSVGRAGIPGKIDRRYDEKYGAALLISAISVAANIQTARSLENGIEIDNLTNSLDDISKQIVTENADIKPVLLAGQGKTILLKPTTDIWFQKPCGFEVKLIPVTDDAELIDEQCDKTTTPQ